MTTRTYWNSKGTLESLSVLLRGLIPDSGECVKARGENKYLDRYRRMVNCYYDLYNNGLYNRRAEFSKMFEVMEGLPKAGANLSNIGFMYFIAEVELNMDIAVAKAALEQRIINREQFAEITTIEKMVNERPQFNEFYQHERDQLVTIFNNGFKDFSLN